jgi:hypothetical protein
MNTLTRITALTLFSLPLLASAAGKSASATMQVTFEVKESCTVQTAPAADKTAKAAPAVTCQLNTPYQAQATATAAPAAASDSRAAAPRQQAADGVWTITF